MKQQQRFLLFLLLPCSLSFPFVLGPEPPHDGGLRGLAASRVNSVRRRCQGRGRRRRRRRRFLGRRGLGRDRRRHRRCSARCFVVAAVAAVPPRDGRQRRQRRGRRSRCRCCRNNCNGDRHGLPALPAPSLALALLQLLFARCRPLDRRGRRRLWKEGLWRRREQQRRERRRGGRRERRRGRRGALGRGIAPESRQ